VEREGKRTDLADGLSRRAALSSRLAALSPQQRLLLERRLATPAPAEPPSLRRRDPDEEAVVGFAQWRLWFLEQIRPGTSAWNTPYAARLRGPLDVDALRRALAAVVERHAPLRTVFATVGGAPVPLTLAAPVVEMAVVDLTDLPDTTRRAAERRFVATQVLGRFDLARDVLVRLRLARVGEDEHVLVLVAHHIACDGWSKRLLIEELCAAYDAFADGREPVLPELPIEYADFTSYERRLLSGENLERLTGYWRDRLRGHAPALQMTTDHPRPPTQRFAGATVRVFVAQQVVGTLTAIGREERATPFMTLLAAFKAMLHLHTGQDDLLVGSPSAMRHHLETEHLIGFFANTLVYRTDLSGRPSFRQVVRRVRESALGVFAHQDLPFDKIVAAANPPRDPSRTPLVQVNFRLEGAEPEFVLRDVRADEIFVDPRIARFDLAIEIAPVADGLAGYLEYDTALFERETALRIAGDFTAVCAALADDPDRPIAALAKDRPAGSTQGWG
jgi:hypothetical protein